MYRRHAEINIDFYNFRNQPTEFFHCFHFNHFILSKCLKIQNKCGLWPISFSTWLINLKWNKNYANYAIIINNFNQYSSFTKVVILLHLNTKIIIYFPIKLCILSTIINIYLLYLRKIWDLGRQWQNLPAEFSTPTEICWRSKKNTVHTKKKSQPPVTEG